MKRHGHTVLRIGIGALFLYAGARKVADPWSFAESIDSFRLIPPALIAPVALGLPMFEVLLGGLLIVGRQIRSAAFGALLLSLLFAMALSTALARGLSIDCGCFGRGKWSTNPWGALGRDALLAVGSYALFVSSSEREQTRQSV